MNVEVYTDGACSGNPGPGGYAFIINSPVCNMKLWGYEEQTTNNRMELSAIVESLKYALSLRNKIDNKYIKIYSDSAYCVEAINQGWFLFWSQNNWCKKDGEKVKNFDLWIKLKHLLDKDKKSRIEFIKVKGHSGNLNNELADNLARMAIKNLNVKKTPSKR